MNPAKKAKMSEPKHPQGPVLSQPLKVPDLQRAEETPFSLIASPADEKAVAKYLGANGARKMRFEGRITSDVAGNLTLTGDLGATISLICVVSLEPFNLRIDRPVRRVFMKPDPETPAQSEVSLAEDFDDDIDMLGSIIDPGEIALEELALCIPVYPRAPEASLGEAQFSAPGSVPLTDETAKPFAALAALKAKSTE